MDNPIPIPMLNVLPPSSDNDSWSPSSSPLPRRHRIRDLTGNKRRTRAQEEDDPGDGDRGRSKKREKMMGRSHSPVSVEGEGFVEELASNSASFLLTPSRCSSPSTRRSRWSLRSFLLKDSDCESCSTASNSPRSTPGSSPSLRRRVLGGRASEGEGQNERTGGGGVDSSSLPTASSSSSLLPTPSSSTSSYPISSRHFTRNAKKMQSWYNVLSPTYKQRNEEFRKLFKKLPETERLIVDYSCALQKDILLQGRLYLSENWICFYSNIFRWETTITILLKEVTNLSKEKTAKLIPNAIQINTEQEKHFFTSFGARDRSFMMIFRLWQNALMDKTLSPKELWHIVHQCYGTELGLTSEDDDYVSPTGEHVNGLLPGDDSSSDVMDPSSASAAPGSSPPSSSSSSIPQPTEVQPPKQSAEPEPTPNTHSTTHSTPPASTTAANNLEEGGQDGQTEQTNQVAPVAHVSSLEMTNDEDLPTDPSNSSDTQEESEVESFCGDLRGRLHINTVVRMSVDKLYELLFSDTHFLQHLFTQRSFTDLSVQEWQKDSSSGISTRVLSYTIAINNPLGPKTAPVVETQTLHKSSSRGVCYVVDSEVITSGIPYQDYFYTVHRYCLTSVSTQKSRLRVSSDICYRKQPWSLVKALIEKNTWSGIEEYYRHMEVEVCKLETLLQSKVSVVCVGESETVKAPPTLRRRKLTGLKRAEGAVPGGGVTEQGGVAQRERRDTGAQYLKVGERWRGSANNNSITLLLIISFILVVLVALNMMLFYKLWALERAAHTLETWQSYSLSDSPLPQSSSEWMKVLQLQRQFHQAQLNKWQQILHSSVTLLDQMKQSLENLHRGIIRSEEQEAVAPPPSEHPTSHTTDTLTEQ
ncbi:protein Aster-A isoform X1 [Hemibagrus wyckioides]|uniref:protein Aster-A isoform X1 n=1 Tax=Hemibagrus wyckioides TaxID=337641 RepID=UPI00266D89A3|nr:protein Aster-A isoform X1 [Hemibagrus wyckioides]XP_058231931.1 protein Aster-A isoform X1 [Hemibagrus wyckioides]